MKSISKSVCLLVFDLPEACYNDDAANTTDWDCCDSLALMVGSDMLSGGMMKERVYPIIVVVVVLMLCVMATSVLLTLL